MVKVALWSYRAVMQSTGGDPGGYILAAKLSLKCRVRTHKTFLILDVQQFLESAPATWDVEVLEN